jgi:Family of unknown function (DUF5677)
MPEERGVSSDPEIRSLLRINARLARLLKGALGALRLSLADLSPAQALVIFAATKASKTHSSILVLCRRGAGEDAAIILRSMFELALDVKYISADASGDRAERWLDYDWVNRYEVRIDKRRLDNVSLSETELEIEKQAQRVQSKWGFWRKRKDGRLVAPQDWSGESTFRLAQLVEWEEHYHTVFRLCSNLAHSATRTANDYVSSEADGSLQLHVGPSTNYVTPVLYSAGAYLITAGTALCELVGGLEAPLQALVRLDAQFTRLAVKRSSSAR